MSDIVFEMKGVSRHFASRRSLTGHIVAALLRQPPAPVLKAVDGVDLTVRKGEVLGLVGESGCGKSTLARIATGILQPSSGAVFYHGKAITAMSRAERKTFLLKAQMIFQDPYASLNPRMTIRAIIGEALRVLKLKPRAEIERIVDNAMAEVGLDPSYASRYPHQFSGGQRQRIGIARALVVEPDFLVCDEPVSALDVSIQAQIINLFLAIKASHGLTYLFVSHDLTLVRHICDRVAIMYLGRIVEQGPAAAIFSAPAHPYTQALIAAAPSLAGRKRIFEPLSGELPSPLNPPSGCPFHPRCPKVMDVCRHARPELRPMADGHVSACHLNMPAE